LHKTCFAHRIISSISRKQMEACIVRFDSMIVMCRGPMMSLLTISD
jgi:hypothetical protein